MILVRSGGLYPEDKLWNPGSIGLVWSSTPYPNGITGYSFATNANPMNIVTRHLGISLRCLSTALEHVKGEKRKDATKTPRQFPSEGL